MSNVLPKLNATPSHELTIPSTQRTVSYRPYLVKEENTSSCIRVKRKNCDESND